MTYLKDLCTVGQGKLYLTGDPPSGSISLTETVPQGSSHRFEVVLTHHAAKLLYRALGRAIEDAELRMRYPEKQGE